jgi:UDP-N-acetylmuramoyl-L-alanyl-D-glutamate--2,6-diaminopimelate ligase
MRDVELGCTGEFVLVVNRAEAIAMALREAKAGDCVLVAGKGHEDYQEVNGERLHFSDVEQVQLSLGQQGRSL